MEFILMDWYYFFINPKNCNIEIKIMEPIKKREDLINLKGSSIIIIIIMLTITFTKMFRIDFKQIKESLID